VFRNILFLPENKLKSYMSTPYLPSSCYYLPFTEKILDTAVERETFHVTESKCKHILKSRQHLKKNYYFCF